MMVPVNVTLVVVIDPDETVVSVGGTVDVVNGIMEPVVVPLTFTAYARM